ncbi:MAG TPA: methylmalonyl-CoA mutase family protein [Acidimicrobiales bacterium]|nr:methylmalonyl-CoA mutase family protein [Acidimicrobiales bacterium]
MGKTPHEPLDEGRARWRERYDSSALRDGDFETMSGVPLAPVYGPDDWPDRLTSERVGWPGGPPYTRGPYASMYRSKLWTMRLFAGYGTAEDTNVRFRELLRAGSGGLSVAFDLPTLMGRDSDDPHAEGEVGRCGVAVDTLADAEDLFSGIDLASVTTSMTINSPAAILLAMYVSAAELTGASRRALGGTLQNDILKEYQAQKEYIFPPRPSMRVVNDVVRFCAAEMPRFHPISVSGYHIREAGSTAAQELAFTLANGFAYVEAALASGLDVDQFAPRLSFFFNAHIDFFEEIAKYRAARRIWARWMTSRYGARNERSAQLRFHTQTAGVSLTAQQPEVNVVRTAIEALAGVLGGTQSLHTNSMDEVLALPTERAARIALRTQQVLAHETGVADVADPLGGSWFVESLTDELERQAEAVFARLDEWGRGSILEGVLHGIEDNWFQGEIADSAYTFQRKVSARRRIVVGVNAFTEGNEEPGPPILQIDADVDEVQRKRLAAVRQRRSEGAVSSALTRVAADAAEPDTNLMPAILGAVRAHATVGEIVGALASVFGRWAEDPVL